MKTLINLPQPVEEYLHAINAHEPSGFLAAFAPDAVVKDAGKELRGLSEIEHWAEKEIFSANVTLELLDALVQNTRCILRVKVDGTFDRTGLPDPFIMDHVVTVADHQIAQLTCRLAEESRPLSSYPAM